MAKQWQINRVNFVFRGNGKCWLAFRLVQLLSCHPSHTHLPVWRISGLCPTIDMLSCIVVAIGYQDRLSDVSAFSELERNGGSNRDDIYHRGGDCHHGNSPLVHHLSSSSSSVRHSDASFVAEHHTTSPQLLTPEAFALTRLVGHRSFYA